MNRLGQRGETELGWNSAAYAARVRAFGWHPIELDGHDLAAIDRAYGEAVAHTGRPTCLIAKTEKGHGVSLVANKEGWHGKALSPAEAKSAITELGGERHITIQSPKPERTRPAPLPTLRPLRLSVLKPPNRSGQWSIEVAASLPEFGTKSRGFTPRLASHVLALTGVNFPA